MLLSRKNRQVFRCVALSQIFLQVFFPFAAIAAEPAGIVVDNRTSTTITDLTGGAFDIKTTTILNNRGFNSFSEFGVAANETVNMHVPASANQLINLVSGPKTEIHGLLRGYENGNIGGDIYFANPNGFLVGAEGVVNVGKLTLATPTTEFMSQLINAGGVINGARADSLSAGQIPISNSGLITIDGLVLAQDGVTLIGSDIDHNGVIASGRFVDTNNITDRLNLNYVMNLDGIDEAVDILVAGDGDIEIISQGDIRLEASESASVAIGTAKAESVIIIEGASLKAQEIFVKAEASAISNMLEGDVDDGILKGVSAVVPGFFLGVNGTYVKADADARVIVKNSDLEATDNLQLTADSQQTAKTFSLALDGAQNAITAAVVIGEVYGNAEVSVEGSSSLQASTVLLDASNVGIGSVTAIGVTSDTVATGALVVSVFDTDAAVSLSDGTVVDATKFTASADNDSQHIASASALALNQENAKAGVAVAYSNVQAGAVVNAGGLYRVEDTRFDANNFIFENTTKSSTAVGGSAITRGLFKGTTDLLSEKLGRVRFDASEFPLQVGAAFSMTEQQHNAETNIAPGTVIRGSLADTSDSKADVLRVNAILSNETVRVHAEATTDSNRETTAAGGAPRNIATSVAVALSNIDNVAKTTVGRNSQIDSDKVQIKSRAAMPWEQTWTRYNNWSDITNYLNGNLGVANGFLTSWANATSETATNGGSGDSSGQVALAGAVSYLDVYTSSEAIIEEGVVINVSGGDWTDEVIAGSRFLDTDLLGNVDPGSGDTSETIQRSAFELIAEQETGSVNVAGNISILLGGTVAGSEAKSLGAGYNHVVYNTDAIAKVHSGAVINATNGAKVQAASEDQIININPSAGRGSGMGFNGVMGFADVTNTTQALVDSSVRFDVANGDLVIDANEELKVVNGSGALNLSANVGVGAAVAVNTVDTDTKAAITAVAGSGTAAPAQYSAINAVVASAKPKISGTSDLNQQQLNIDIDIDSDGTADANYSVTTAADGSWNLDLATIDGGNFTGLVDGQLATVSVTAEGRALAATSDLIYSSSDSVHLLDSSGAKAGLLSGISNITNATLAIDVDVDGVAGADVTYGTNTDANGNWSLDLHTATPLTGQVDSLLRLTDATVDIDVNNGAATTQATLGLNNRANQLLVEGRTRGHIDAAGVAAAAVFNDDPGAPNAFDSSRLGAKATDWSSSNGRAQSSYTNKFGSGLISAFGGSGMASQPTYAVSGAGSVAVNITNLDTTARVDNYRIAVTDSRVEAVGDTDIGAGAGAAAITKANNSNSEFSVAVTGTVAVNVLDNSVTSTVSGSEFGVDGDFSVRALNGGIQESVAIGLALNPSASSNNSNTAMTGSFSFNDVINNTTATTSNVRYVRTDDGSIDDNGIDNIEVIAYDKARLGTGGGSMYATRGGSQGGYGAGLAYADADIESNVTATMDSTSVANSPEELVVAAEELVVAAIGEQKITTGAGMLGFVVQGNGTNVGLGGALALSKIRGSNIATLSNSSQTTASSVLVTANALSDTDQKAALDARFDVSNVSSYKDDDATLGLTDSNGNYYGDGIQGYSDFGRAKITGVAVVLQGTQSGSNLGVAYVDNDIAVTRAASIIDSKLTVTGDTDVVARDNSITGGVAIGLGAGSQGSASFSFSGAGSAVQNTINNTVSAEVLDSEVDSGSLLVDAANDGVARALAGAIAIAEQAAAAISVTINRISNNLTARIAGNRGNAVSDVDDIALVRAESSAKIETIAIGGSLAYGGDPGGALAGSVGVTQIKGDVKALVEANDSGEGAKIAADGSVGVVARRDDYIGSVAGSAAVSFAPGAGIAGAVTVNDIDGKTQAGIYDADTAVSAKGGTDKTAVTVAQQGLDSSANSVGTSSLELGDFRTFELQDKRQTTTKTGVVVNSSATQHLEHIDIGFGAANGWALAVNTNVNNIDGLTLAEITSSVIQATDTADVSVTASNHNYINGFLGAVAIGIAEKPAGAAVAAGVDVTKVGRSTVASIRAADVESANDVEVDAQSSSAHTVTTMGGALAVSSGVGVGGAANVSFTREAGETYAVIENSLIAASGTTVNAQSRQNLHQLAGAVGVGVGTTGVGVGASVLVAENYHRTHAWVDDSTVTGLGLTTANSVSVTAHSEKNYDTVSIAGAAGVGNTGAGAIAGAVSLVTINSQTASGLAADLGDDDDQSDETYVAAANLTNSTDKLGDIGLGNTSVLTATERNNLNNDLNLTSASSSNPVVAADGSITAPDGVGAWLLGNTLVKASHVEVSAEDKTHIDSDLGAVALSGSLTLAAASVGAAVGVANVYNRVNAYVGDAVTITDLESLTVKAEALDNNGKTADIYSLAGAGSTGVAFAASVALANLENAVNASLGGNITMAEGDNTESYIIIVEANDTTSADTETTGVAVALFGAAGASVAQARKGSDSAGARANLGADITSSRSVDDYKFYWQQRGIDTEGGSTIYQPTAYDSNYQYSLSAIDKAGLSDQSVAAIETDKTNTYHAIHNSIGNVAYNPEFSWQDNLAALDIDVKASTSGRIDALAVGLSGGAVALGAVVAYAQDISTTQAGLADGVVINAVNADLSIDASAAPEVEATATGVNVGYLAVGGSFSTAESKTKVNAFTGSNNALTLNKLDINARQLRSGSNQDGITANTRSVGGAGAMYGIVAADSESVIDSQTNARLGSENSLNIGSDLTLNATAVSKAVATTYNIIVGGIVIGSADATAKSSQRVEASVAGSASGDVGGLMTVNSRSEEDSLADTTAGQGGAISGVAADGVSSVSGTSIAQIGDDTDTAVEDKDVTDWTVGRLNIVANHIGKFNTEVNTINASVVGASGGTAKSSGASDVQAKLGADQKVIVADRGVTNGEGDLLIKAYNQLLKTNRDETVESGSGGLIDAPAVESFTRVNNQVTASVGNNVELIVEDNNANLDQRSLEIVAVNELNIRDKVSLKSGGAIPIAKARSEITNNLLSSSFFSRTYNRDVVKVDIGDSAIVRNEDYESSVTLAARTTAKFDSTAHAKTWGFAASGTGDAITHYNIDNQINVGDDATVYAEGNVYLRAGKDEDGVAGANFISSVVKVWNKSLTFFLDSEDATATLDQNNTINIASGAKVQAVTDVFLDTATEDSSRVVRGNGESNETNLGVAEDIAAFSNDIFDGSDIVLRSATGDAFDFSNFTVTVDGEVRAGVKNRQDMIVKYSGATTQINLPGNGSVQLDDINIDVTNGEGIDYGVRATVSLEDQFTTAIRSLENQILAFGGDNLAKLAMENDLDVLRNRRAELGVDRRIDIIDINNAYAASGDIHIDAEGVSGSGQLTAPADVRIGITNNTHYFVNIKDAKIPETAGGRLFLNGASFNETSLGGVQVDATADTDSNPLIQVYNSFNPNMDRRNDPYTNNPGDNGYLAPDIWIAGELINRRGTINIRTDYGNIRSSGTIDAGQPSIQAPNGEFFQSYTPGFMNFGSAPWEQYGGLPEVFEARRKDFGPVSLFPQPSVKSMILGKNIAISAQYLNINGSIQSGFADWNVVIDTPDASLDYYDRLHDRGIQSKFSLQTVNANTGSPSVWYNAATRKIEMDPIRAQGGEIRLFGHVISTGSGQITARDGYGSIAIVNNTSRVLALNELDTGAGSDFGVGPLEGRVTLIDTAKLDANGRPLTSIFTRDNGVITRNSYYEQEDGSRTAQSSQAGATTYNPVAGQRYHWVTGQTSTKRKTKRYIKETGWFFGEQDWISSDPGSFQYTRYKDLSPAEILEGNSGQYLQSGQSDNPFYFYDFTENPVADATGDEGYKYKGYKVITDGKCIGRFFGACVEWRYTTDKYYEKGREYLHNHSVYASYPIGIGFIGNEVEGAINISSGAGVDLTARVHNDTGLTTITAGGTGILATSDAVFEVDNLMLDANGAVNSRIGGSDDTQALTVRQTQIGSWVSAMTQSGSINIDADFGNGLNVDSITSSGAVKLAADSNISTTATGAVAAKSITLASSLGVIGSASNALNIDTAEDGVLTASADGSIYVHEVAGNLSLNSVVSRGGDIELLVDGDLLDGNSLEVDDELAIDALRGLWSEAGLTGQDAQDSIDDQIAAYESEKTASYKSYWQARNVREENGNYVADSYNPDFQYVLPDITKAGLTNSQISTLESNRTTTYHQVHTDIGGTAIFDDSYSFTLTDPDQIAALSRGGSWSEYELQNVLQSFLVKGDTQIRIEEANIAAAGNVMINAGGQVGNQSGVIEVAKEANPVAMSDSVRVALAAAERDDITFFTDSDGNTTGIQIEQKEDVDIEVGGSLSIVATGAAYIGSQEEDININTVTSGSDVRIKTDKGIVQVNSGVTSIVAEDLILESASLDIGDEDTPLIVELTGKLTARAAKGSIYLTQANGDLNLDVINAKNVIALTAANGNILDAVKSAQVNIASASKLYLDASGSIGTQDNYLDLVLGNGEVSAIANSVYLAQTGALLIDQLDATTAVGLAATQSILLRGNIEVTDDVSLVAGGDIKDDNDVTDDIKAQSLTLAAGGDVNLDTAVAELAVNVGGELTLDELDDVSITALTTQQGDASITSGGSIDASSTTIDVQGDLNVAADDNLLLAEVNVAGSTELAATNAITLGDLNSVDSVVINAANGPVVAQTIDSPRDIRIAANSINAQTIQSDQSISLLARDGSIETVVLDAPRFELVANGPMNLGTVTIADSLALEAETVEADIQHTGDTLKLNLVGFEGGKATSFNLAIETQGAIEVDQLHADNGSLVSNAKTLKVKDAWITERVLLSTKDMTSVINNQNLAPELDDVQLYSASQYLDLLLQAGQVDTDARFIHGRRDLKLISGGLEAGETVMTRVRDAVEIQLQGLRAIVTDVQQPIGKTDSNIAIQRSLKNIQPNAAKWSDFSEGADEISNKLPICTELLCAQPNKQSQQQTDTAPKEERLELSFRAQ